MVHVELLFRLVRSGHAGALADVSRRHVPRGQYTGQYIYHIYIFMFNVKFAHVCITVLPLVFVLNLLIFFLILLLLYLVFTGT